MKLTGTFKKLFGMEERVARKSYIFWGAFLMFIKYSFECILYALAAGKFLTPFDFLSPMVSDRYPGFSGLPDWFIPTVVLWSLPFIWIGVGMSVRRAADANISPWLGALFFVPLVNYLLMFVLSLAPTSPFSQWGESKTQKKYSNIVLSLKFTAVFVLLFALLGTMLIWFNTHFLETYTVSLFLAVRLLLGWFRLILSISGLPRV